MPNVTDHAAGTLTWVDLMTPDLDAASRFYGALFGWVVEKGPESLGYYSMCLNQGRLAAAIGVRPPDAPYPSAWSVYFATDDAQASAARMGTLGGTVTVEPMEVPGNQGTMLVATDPTGGVFGLWQSGEHRGFQVENEPGAVVWSELNTLGAQRAADFFSSLLGLESRRMPGEHMTYFTLHRGGAPEPFVGVMEFNARHPSSTPPHWGVYFGVTSTDGAVKQVAAAGGKVLMPATDTPYGRMAFVSDPWGAAFIVIQRSS